MSFEYSLIMIYFSHQLSGGDEWSGVGFPTRSPSPPKMRDD